MRLLIAFVIALVAAPLRAGPAAQPADLAWLAGCWGFERDGRRYEEVWLAPSADGLMGMARTTLGGKTVNDEFTRVVPVFGGSVAYVAHPSGQAPAQFGLVEISTIHAVFANPQHDFPTRIGYRYTAPGALDAWIEGTLDGQPKRIEYPYQRVACPGNRDSPR